MKLLSKINSLSTYIVFCHIPRHIFIGNVRAGPTARISSIYIRPLYMKIKYNDLKPTFSKYSREQKDKTLQM